MKLTRRHLRDLIIEIAKENKTMIPNRIKHNYLAVSSDESDQDFAREHGIMQGVIPHGYVVLEPDFGHRQWDPPTLVTHDDIIALSDTVAKRINLNTDFPEFDLIKSLGITHIMVPPGAVSSMVGADAALAGDFADNNSVWTERGRPRRLHSRQAVPQSGGYLMPLNAFSEYHKRFRAGRGFWG